MKKTILICVILHTVFTLNFTNAQWVVQNSGANLNISSVDFVNADIGWAAGSNSRVYRTTNGGAVWNTITVPGNPVNFTHSVSKEIDKMWPGTKNMIFGTTNGGTNWFSTFLGARYVIGDMDIRGNNLFTSAYLLNNAEDSILSAAVFRSTNDGINWTQISSISMNASGDPIHGVDVKLGLHFISNDTGYIATLRGVYKTINGGMNFNFLQSSPPSSRTVVAGSNNLSSSTSFFVGVDKPNKLEIYKGINGGSTWLLLSEIPDPADTKQFSGISCPDNTDKIYITINNRSMTTGSVQDTSVYYSSNGGANWYYQTLPVTNLSVNSIDFPNPNTGYIACSNGTVLKTTNGGAVVGVQQVSNQIPDRYNLYQNYPNPFNPFTKIKFDIASQENIKLAIYDVSGKELAVLVNAELQAGSYSVNWDAGLYTSGIYFYRMSWDSFSETKKMLLVK